MLASIVVVPRERFTSLPVSLRSPSSTIAEDVPVVVVEVELLTALLPTAS